MKLIPNSITQKLGRQVLTMKKNSPRTLFVLGIAGVVGSTVLACRATMKLEGTLEDFTKDIDETKERGQLIPDNNYERRDYNKDMVFVYAKGSYSIVKLYAPAILLGSASIAALTGSHVTLSRRNASLTAAYSALQMSFDAYRERVREELDAEKELDIYHAATVHQMGVDGKIEELRKADPNKWSPYARFFEESNVNWQKNAELNRLFIQCQQNYLNHLLQARGHVFLNEAYDALGLGRSQAGQAVGWVIGDHDNYIDFGLYEASNANFINGWERNVILDFNVDGVIFDKI